MTSFSGQSAGGWPLVGALAFGQLVSWGALHYAFTLFVAPMEAELGWSREALNGALSAGLVASALAAYPAGRWIDRFGGRGIMTTGTLLGALMLLAWSRVGDLAVFFAIWIAIGVAAAGTLYGPVFAVLVRLYPADYSRRITVLTLVGGFASTVFIPLTQFLIASLGWRDALVALAGIVLIGPLPIHFFLLRDAAPVGASTIPTADGALRRALGSRAFWGLAVCFTASSAVLSAFIFHFVPLLSERGFALATIVAAFTVFGPCQVAGRLVLLGLGARASAIVSGRIAVLLPLAAIAMLLVPVEATILPFLFLAVYGLANGVMTIVRGTAVPELLGREGYGAITGALTLPASLAAAFAPYAAAWLWAATGGYDAVITAALVGAAVAVVGFWLASR